MESALLSASAILPLQNKWQSSFYGKGICNGVLVRRSISYAGRRSPLTVSSVLGRKVKKVKKETIVPDPDYRIPVVLLGAAGSLIYTDNLLAAAPIGLLGLLLLFQTTRVRFVFDDEALVQSYRICQLQAHNLKAILDQGSQCNASAGINHTDILLALVICVLLEVKVGEQLEESGENVFVGGKNRWKYSTFVNWELWWPNFPVLVYFKETQTKPEGQVHFFPVIFNGKQLYDVMVERCGSSKTSSPK